MKGKKILMTIACSIFAFIINYVINFLLTPFITNNIGADAYGYVSLAKNFTSYASIFTIALNSYAARFIAVEYHQNRMIETNKFYSSVFFANVALSLLIFLGAIVGTYKLEYIIHIPDVLYFSVKLLFLVVFLSFTVSTIGSVFSVSAYIKNKLDIVSVVKIVSYVTEGLALALLFKLYPAQLWFVGIGILLSTLVILISNIYITFYYVPELKIRCSLFSFPAVKKLVVNGAWNSLNGFGNALNGGLDLIISNLLLSPLAMGQLAIAKTIGTMMQMLFSVVGQAFQPTLLQNYSENDKIALIKNLKLSVKLTSFLCNLSFAGFVGLGLSYYNLWIPKQDTKLIYVLTIVTLLSYLMEGAVNPLYYVYTLTLKNKIPCLITILGGIINLISMYFLITYTNIGIFAVVWTTAIITSVINFIFNPIYMCHCLCIKKTTFYPVLCKHILSCVIMTLSFCTIGKFIKMTSWWSLVIGILLCCIVGVIVHGIVMLSKEDLGDLLEVCMSNK